MPRDHRPVADEVWLIDRRARARHEPFSARRSPRRQVYVASARSTSTGRVGGARAGGCPEVDRSSDEQRPMCTATRACVTCADREEVKLQQRGKADAVC